MKTNLLLIAGAGLAIFFLLPKGEAETSRSSTETVPYLDFPYSDITPKSGSTGETYYTSYNLGDVAFPQISIPPATDAPKDTGGNIAPALRTGTSSGTIIHSPAGAYTQGQIQNWNTQYAETKKSGYAGGEAKHTAGGTIAVPPKTGYYPNTPQVGGVFDYLKK